MTNTKNLLYYSSNTYLSYIINRRFYKGKHYVWVSPVFNPAALDAMHEWYNIPASSSPHDIYIDYRESTLKIPDRHSNAILRNIKGLRRGARKLFGEGIINENQYQLILYMIKNAQIIDFRPVLYLILASIAENKIRPVEGKDLANPLGIEYRIFDLLDNEFEILEFKR